MNQGDVIKAFPALISLTEQRMDAATAWKLFTLMEKFEGVIRFQRDAEQKLVEQYEGKYNEDGSITFKERGRFAEFSKKLEELHGINLDFEIEPIEIDITANSIQISPRDIMNLKGIVEIKGV